MKKLGLWILILVMVSMAFVGCGGKEEATNEPATDEVEADVAVEELSNKEVKTLEKLLAREAELGSYSYSVDMEMMEGVTSSVKFYKKLPWMRMESTVEGLPTMVTLMNTEEGKIYSIDDANKQIMVMADPEMFMEPTAGLDMMIEENAVPEGTELEKVDYKGKKALLLSFEMPDVESGGTIGSKIWYDEAYGVPLAYEINAGADQQMLTEFNYDFSEVSDDMFMLPEGYKMMDLGDMDSMFEGIEGMEGMEDLDLEGMDLDADN